MDIEVPYDTAVILTWLSFILVGGFFLWIYFSVRRSARSTDLAAVEHLKMRGYTNISGLAKDAQGRWAGSATKDGKTFQVAVDMKGNIAAT
jgi:hypothetical protein